MKWWASTLLGVVLLVGGYAQRWHLPGTAAAGLTATVADWQAILDRPGRPRYLPLPHPSWRNNAWLKANPWFARELVPRLRQEVSALIRPT